VYESKHPVLLTVQSYAQSRLRIDFSSQSGHRLFQLCTDSLPIFPSHASLGMLMFAVSLESHPWAGDEELISQMQTASKEKVT
jgi:hypothetical protein